MSTPTGNAYLSFDYDGRSYDLGFVNVTQYEQRPEYAADGYTLDRYAVTVAGTALIADGATNTFVELASKIRDGTGRIDSFDLRINSQTLISKTGPDAMRGPLLQMSATEITGRRAVLLTFTLSASLSQANIDGSATPLADYPLISHTWTQAFTLDAGGLVTRTVRGTLMVNIGATGLTTVPADDGQVANVTGLVPWPDIYRKCVLPVTDGSSIWRRESQTFAINETGNALTYEIQDSQARTNLPDGAFGGTCDFTYERNRRDLAYATLRFSCELEGQVDGDVRHLIWAAVDLATTRIPFSKAILDRLVVTEQEMLKKAKVRLEIDARAPATDLENPTASVGAVPLARLVGIGFTVNRTCSFAVGAYGSDNLGVYGRPHWDDNNSSAKPGAVQDIKVATIVAFVDALCPLGTPATVLLVPDTDFTAANSLIVQGPFPNEQLSGYNSSGQTTSVEKVFTTTNVAVETRMHRLQTMYTQGADFVFQAGKARVILEEVTTVRRTNSPPNRVFRPIPSGFVVVSEDWKVNHGEIDAAGQRSFTGIYVRRLMSFDGGGATSNGYSTVSGRRQWWVPGASPSVAAPLALGYNLDNQVQANNVFAFGSSPQTYPVGTAQNYA
jgi:hypothetical protein